MSIIGLMLIVSVVWGVFVWGGDLVSAFSGARASELSTARIQTANLLAQLTQQKQNLRVIFDRQLTYREARVYSTYPFNNRKTIVIDAGSNDGLTTLMPVAVAPGVLLGYISDITPSYSIVRTVLSSDFKIPVRIGQNSEDALLEGGNAPIASMIERTKKIAAGDPIYTASAQFPYGLLVGTVNALTETDGGYFKNAGVQLSYAINELKTVFVITNYVGQH